MSVMSLAKKRGWGNEINGGLIANFCLCAQVTISYLCVFGVECFLP